LSFVTTTSTVPPVTRGAVRQVRVVSPSVTTSSATAPPIVTRLTPAALSWKPEPVIVSAVPPLVGPLVGETEVICAGMR
jgi:hypothetical protein